MQFPPRQLSESERRTLEALLSADFVGATELRSQIEHTVVVGTCDCGCPTVHLQGVSEIPPPPIPKGWDRLAPVRGEVEPLGGELPASIILFLDKGRLSSPGVRLDPLRGFTANGLAEPGSHHDQRCGRIELISRAENCGHSQGDYA